MPKKKLKTARPTRPSVAVQREYQKKLEQLIDRMNRSTVYWLKAEYRKEFPQLAQDTLPSKALSEKLHKIMKKWRKEFNEDAEVISDWFVHKLYRFVKNSVYQSLKDAGLVIHKRMTRSEMDVLRSLIIQNVSLIKTIPDRYFSDIEFLVQACVQNGRDMGYLTAELEKRYNVTHKRAVVISRDQTNKATEQMSMERNKALGITQGIWMHTSGGKTYRSTHVAMNGKVFNLNEGLYDPDVGHNVLPAECINCRCTFKPVIPFVINEDDL